ncbi:MAG TPA: adenylate kinase [Blastocatellia bacterium]|nr:adenylate kinase [Blastocatellia bacterium]
MTEIRDAVDLPRGANGDRPQAQTRILVLLGAPGVGKGTQARLLAEQTGFPQISTGDILREMAKADTPLGLQIRSTQAAGRLVSDEVLAEVIRTRTAQPDCDGGYILDGFPRTLNQARMLETLAREQNREIQVIKLNVHLSALMQRLTGRRTCPQCGEIYNVFLKPPQQDGFCDRDQTPLAHRSDDREEAVLTRVTTYESATRPLTDHYEQLGRLIRIDAAREVDEVFQDLYLAVTDKIR